MRRAPAVAIVLAVALAACGPQASGPTFPPLGVTPPPAGNAALPARQRVFDALAAVGLQAVDAGQPYRPQEGARLSAAPRSVLQVQLANDPSHGFIVVYPFDSPAAATAAANDQAAYIASSPGHVQTGGANARFVLRVVGSSVVFFTWTPGSSPDPKLDSIGAALSTLGVEVPIPG